MIWNLFTSKLNQLHIPFFYVKPIENNSVFLTFDDGPNKNTQQLFDFLDQQNISSTHFWLFSHKIPNKSEIKSLKQKIAVHGWNHTRYSKLRIEEIKLEFEKVNNTINKTEMTVSSYFRPPYGSFKFGLTRICKTNNLKLIYWSHLFEDYLDDFNLGSIKITASSIQSGSIIVLHDKEKHFNRICESVLILKTELSKRNLRLSCLPS